ncbi:MAG: hypothetical protein U0871_11400 [Gemmataceae bacterium]
MPIRFRCPTCMGLLSIARRKAAATIACPKCGETVIVPDLPSEPDLAPDVSPAGSDEAAVVVTSAPPKRKLVQRHHDPKLFEKDIEQLLDKFIPAPPPPPERAAAEPEPVAVEVAAKPKADDAVYVSRLTAAVLGVLALVLLGVAFVTGFFIGRAGG